MANVLINFCGWVAIIPIRIYFLISGSLSVLLIIGVICKPTVVGNQLEREGLSRRSLHAVPPQDYTILNSSNDRCVPESMKNLVLPEGRPAVLIFLKADCECSKDFLRMFTALKPRLQESASCLAVIEGTNDQAKAFLGGSEQLAPFLAQQDSSLARFWGVSKAGVVALVRPDGKVEAIWPGISRQVFRDISNRLGNPNMIPAESLNALPGASMAGCPLQSSSSFTQGTEQ